MIGGLGDGGPRLKPTHKKNSYKYMYTYIYIYIYVYIHIYGCGPILLLSQIFFLGLEDAPARTTFRFAAESKMCVLARV